jgi:DnaJ-class molecular chaperone
MMAEPRIASYERCPSCNGSGLALNTFSGEPDECTECNGGYVRARNKRGQFTSNDSQPSLTGDQR